MYREFESVLFVCFSPSEAFIKSSSCSLPQVLTAVNGKKLCKKTAELG